MTRGRFAALAVALLAARGAVAQSAVMRAPARDPAPAEPSTDYRHDGFFARLDGGVGRFIAGASANGAADRTFTGTSLSLSVALGGNVRPGFLFGGLVQIDRVTGLSAQDEVTGEVDVERIRFSHTFVGPVAFWYLDPSGGLHFQTAVGIADLNVSSSAPGDNTPDPTGFGLQIGAGWDAYLDRGVAAGLGVRLLYAPLEVTESFGGGATNVNLLIPSVALNLTID